MSRRRLFPKDVAKKYDDMTAVIRSDASDLPLPDSCVDLIVTSPPFYAMRSYQDDGEHYGGQIGSEDTPQEFVDNLSVCMAEWRRVLKPSGSVWINLGDKYGDKTLIGLPWRFAIAQISVGWILRAEVIWSKPNGLPEGVKDRVMRSHEQWFHFVKDSSYFSALDAIREPYQHSTIVRARTPIVGAMKARDRDMAIDGGGYNDDWSDSFDIEVGRVPNSVWTIPKDSLTIPDDVRNDRNLPEHFAAFPQELPRRIILGWSSKEGIVLDPFGGTGTTAGVARTLGRYGISNDLSDDYNRLAVWRIWKSGHFEKSHKKWLNEKELGPTTPLETYLMSFDGIGKISARAIVDAVGNPFTLTGDITQAKGVGNKTVENMYDALDAAGSE